MTEKPLGIYIHIPFCVRKCDYCDFFSAPADAETRSNYVNQLIREIELESAGDRFSSYKITSVFFGGGTPSLLEVSQIDSILCKLKERFAFRKEAEVTLEMNPGTVTKEKLAGLKDAGINRISIGAQSFQDGELALLGRIHMSEDVFRLWEWTDEIGYVNRNIDLMTGIPGQTAKSLADTLAKAIALAPEHISAYSLIVEEGTPFFARYPNGAVDEDTDRELYALTGEMLAKSGYERYEISNYAREGYRCRHNLAYWTRGEYLGFGAGAASMIRNVRFRDPFDMAVHVARLDGALSFNDYVNQHEEVARLSGRECMAETMFLGLRLKEGVALDAFWREYGVPMQEIYGEVLQKHTREGLLKVSGGRVFLTEKGTDVSNYVMADFLL